MANAGVLSGVAVDQASMDLPSPKPSVGRHILFALVVLLSLTYMARELKRGWAPSDEGTLALSADHVLQGELPHRDYHEGYTGGLSYLNALSFRIFGTNLASMRYMLFLFFAAWIPAFYYAASRFVSAPLACAVTLAAVAWGPPNYAAAMPSWYNLFFATFGMAALLRHIETQAARCLLLAGVCGGVSILFKPTGLYFVNGALLFLVFREQFAARSNPADRGETFWYKVFVTASIFLYEGLVLTILHKVANVATYLYFWAPELAVGGVIIWREFHVVRDRSHRFRSLFRDLLIFGAGIAIPTALFLVPYIRAGAVGFLVRDVFVVSGRLIQHVDIKPPGMWFAEGTVVNLLMIGVFLLTRSKQRLDLADKVLLGTPLVILIPSALFLAYKTKYFYQLVWSTIWVLAPFVALIGAWILAGESSRKRLGLLKQQRLFLALSVMSACSLVQFPNGPIYFCYVAPLVLLAATAAVSAMENPPRLGASAMLCFCFLYVILELTPGFVYHFGVEYTPDIQTVHLSLPRAGGLRVSPSTAQEYEQVTALIRQHARGEYILAKPDSPEVYFLSGLRDPSGIFFDFYEDPSQRTQHALDAIREHNINLVVLNRRPPFSAPIPDDLRATIEDEFPNRADAGDFEVRWKR